MAVRGNPSCPEARGGRGGRPHIHPRPFQATTGRGSLTEPAMSIETWLAFTAATAVLLVIPGPTILLVVSYALGQGMRTALPVAVGVALGDFTAMTLSMLGLGAWLGRSSLLFTALKRAGALYLVWLRIQLWRAGGTGDAVPLRPHAPA